MHFFFFFFLLILHTPLHLFVYQTFCLYNNYLVLFTLLKEKKRKKAYVLKENLYEILSLEASIQGKKIVNNNLHSSIV
jgi:hypothetical protein